MKRDDIDGEMFIIKAGAGFHQVVNQASEEEPTYKYMTVNTSPFKPWTLSLLNNGCSVFPRISI